MKRRFEGNDGKRLLVDALKNQHLIEHDAALAARVAEKGELVEFKPGDTLIVQGSADNDIYFLIDGEVGVFVNKRSVAQRKAHDSIGEMAFMDGSARRSATVSALKPTVAVKVTEALFNTIAGEFPHVWRAIAIVVADRLRERERFHRPPNEKPVLFIGSSVEGLGVAKQIQLGLKHASLVAQIWTNGVFGPGGIPIDSLTEQVDKSDFAVFVFGPDDKTVSRTEELFAPRDNIVFELGMFMGRLARDRTFIVKEQSSDIKIPTDLLGVTPISYVCMRGADLGTIVGPVCTEIETCVDRLGVM